MSSRNMKEWLFPAGVRATALLALLALFCATAAAQTTGTIYGQVSDPSGAAVPEASITAQNTATGLEWKAVSSSVGSYLVPSLPSGPYKVTIEHAGFETYVQSGITVTVGENARVDAELRVGAVTQSVEVSASALRVDTQSSTVGSTIDSRRVADMPLSGRNLLQLMSLLPGVGQSANMTPLSGLRTMPVVTVSGSRPAQNNLLLDGTSMVVPFTNQMLMLPTPDAVQEFRVLTNNFDAQYGRASGGVMLAVSKSGSNEWHGSLFEYVRNDVLNARNFFAADKPSLRQNQFGGSIGGPVRLPRYNGRDRTFFFFAYQGTRIVQQSLITNFPPSALERQGIFATTVHDPNGGNFPNNTIPQDRWDPFTQNMLALVPYLPNRPNGSAVLLDKYPSGGNQYTVRFDHQVNPSNRLRFRWYRALDSLEGGPGQGMGDVIGVHARSHYLTDTENLAYTTIFSPRLLNEVAFSALRSAPMMTGIVTGGPRDFGANYNADAGTNPTPPAMMVSGRFFLFPGFTLNEPETWFQLRDNLSWMRGRHSLRMGTEIGILRHSTLSNLFSSGFHIFVGAYTGNAFGDYLLGRPYIFQNSSLVNESSRGRNYHFYVQDDFKVNARLTLNLGLRYELNLPWWQKWGHGATIRPGAQSQLFPTAPPGLVYPGDPGVSRALVDTDKNDFGPRIGFAWDLTGKGRTALRGAYGVFYNHSGGAGFSSNTAGAPPFSLAVNRAGSVASATDPYDVAHGGIDPFPYQVDPANPVFPAGTFSAYFLDRDYRNGYLQNFNLNIQHQFGGGLVLQTAYVGGLGKKLYGNQNWNQPVYGPGATSGNIQSRRPFYPQYYAGIFHWTSDRSSWYHSFQMDLQKKFSHGYTFQVAYTYSKSIDNGTSSSTDEPWALSPNAVQDALNYLKGQQGLSDFDRRHILVANFIWEIPFMKQNRFLGGWQISDITSYRSGLAFSVAQTYDSMLTGAAGRADLVGDWRLDPNRSHGELIQQYFNTAAFASPPLGRWGSSGRNIVTGPGTSLTSISIQKKFKLPGERGSFQFRSDIFNLFNQVNFSFPNASVGTAGYGQITGAGEARVVQLALRYDF